MIHLPFETTPVKRLDYFSTKLDCQLYCKRDDLFQEAGGGSKARMLQYILAEVNPENYDVLLTAGGPCSNFNRACALMCAKLGLPMHLVEYSEFPLEFDTSLNYFITKLASIKTTRCNKRSVVETLESIKVKYKRENKRVFHIYGGGKSLQGIYAYYDAVKELKSQIDDIKHVFVACGTGTTLTGICAGMQEFFPKAKVHAISVARTYEEEIDVLKDNMNLLNDYLYKSYSFENLFFYDNYILGGYGMYNDDLFKVIKESISKEGLLIDPTYSGKAFYGMIDILSNLGKLQNEKVLFWNTGALFNLLSLNHGSYKVSK